MTLLSICVAVVGWVSVGYLLWALKRTDDQYADLVRDTDARRKDLNKTIDYVRTTLAMVEKQRDAAEAKLGRISAVIEQRDEGN